MVLRDAPTPTVARRRGRPVGSDSAETRNRILAASRQVINERGYQAATFQAIAQAAGLSRPTLHYYFASRGEIYRSLVAEAGVVLTDCIAAARRHDTLAEQFSAFIVAMHQVDSIDRSQVAFLVSARLECSRNPELSAYEGLQLSDFLTKLVGSARNRGELPEGSAIEPVVEMLRAMLWGVGFYAGFIEDAADMHLIVKEFSRLFSHGLFGGSEAQPTIGDTKADTPSVVGGRQ